MFTNSWYTGAIVLDDITETTFEKYRLSHGIPFWGDLHGYFSRIRNPINHSGATVSDYIELIYLLFEHPYAKLLSVRNYYARGPGGERRRWEDLYWHDVNSSTVEEKARMAAANPWKENFFEMKYGNGPDKPMVIIEFIEYKGRLIGSRITVPPNLADLFTINGPKDDTRYGIWPKNGEKQVHVAKTKLQEPIPRQLQPAIHPF